MTRLVKSLDILKKWYYKIVEINIKKVKLVIG